MNFKQGVFSIFLSIALCFMGQAKAFGGQTIILTDGSIIKGQIIGASENNFVIKSQTTGTHTIEQSRVLEISREKPRTASSPQQFSETGASLSRTGNSQQFEQIESALMSNPKIMQAIQDLLSDPEILDLLEDPELSDVIQNETDPASLMSNPAFMKVLSHPKTQAVVEDAVTDMLGSGMLNQ